MRILLPTIRDPRQIGGTTTHLDMLSAGLQEAGHEPHVLYLGDRLPAACRRLGIEWPAGVANRVRRGWGMVYAAEMRGRLLARVADRELARGDYRVVNAQEVYSVPHLRRVADRHRVPLVLTLHGYPLYESVSEGYTGGSDWGKRYLERSEVRALRLADAVVTVDARLHRHVLRLVPECADAVSSLMNFIDTTAFRPTDEVVAESGTRAGAGEKGELLRRWDVPEGKVVLFCPRRLVKKNGVIYPALALASMPKPERERFLLLHAGEGGERAAVEEIIRSNGLEGQVRMLGGQDREAVQELYRLADIVLVPSVHSENVEEATSLAALEAMASGRPLIAGAVGGLAEMVQDGENGLLVPAGDTEALAEAIRRLAGDETLGRHLAERARTYVQENHSHVRAAEEYVRVYEDAGVRAAEAETVGSDKKGRQGRLRPGVSILGLPVNLMGLEEAASWATAEATDHMEEGAAVETTAGETTGRSRFAVSMNPELVMRAHRDPVAMEAVMDADLRLPDGVGMVWAARRQGASGAERVPGIELAELVLEHAAAAGRPVYLLGAAPGTAEEAAENLKERFPRLTVVGTRDGYFRLEEEVKVVAAVRESGAEVLLTGMGAPRQEIFLHRNRERLGVDLALGVGGSLDVWAGRVRRAPVPFQRLGLEWLYRLFTDPRRMGRQLVLPRFVLSVLAGSAEDYGRARGRGAARAPEEHAPEHRGRSGCGE